jgi:rubrerythrin
MRAPEKSVVEASAFRAIIDLAVKREKAAAAGYQALMAKVRDRAARDFLAELRDEERTHKKLLQDLLRGRAVAAAPGRVPDLGLSDFLIEEPPGEDMSYQDLLIFAARKEQRAVLFYETLAARAASAKARKLFEFLAGREKAHKLRLESEYESRFLGED